MAQSKSADNEIRKQELQFEKEKNAREEIRKDAESKTNVEKTKAEIKIAQEKDERERRKQAKQEEKDSRSLGGKLLHGVFGEW